MVNGNRRRDWALAAANAGGQTSGLGSAKLTGLITLAPNVTPWAAPATGDPVETMYGTCVVTATEESNDDSPFAGKIECRLP